jgi:hypothetical protein
MFEYSFSTLNSFGISEAAQRTNSPGSSFAVFQQSRYAVLLPSAEEVLPERLGKFIARAPFGRPFGFGLSETLGVTDSE